MYTFLYLNFQVFWKLICCYPKKLSWMAKNLFGKVYHSQQSVFCKQECIPVGCVPYATVAVCWEGVGVCSGEVCSRGVPAPGGEVGMGVSAPGGVPAPRGAVIPACTEADPPVDRQTGVKT